ncbi:MAG: type II toxin-antitoxin system VapC family toxin [Phycisphaeraceae bacterium]
MSAVVLDASVLIKLYINEDGSRRAVNAVKKAEQLLAPDLIWSEAGNILWKYVRREELHCDAAESMLQDMLQLPMLITASADLVGLALELAVQANRSVYDCLYLALAVKANAVMLTADQRLANALAGTALGKLVRGL